MESTNIVISAVVDADRPLNTYKLAYHVMFLTERKAGTKTGDSFVRPSDAKPERNCTASSERVKMQLAPAMENTKNAGKFAPVRPQLYGLSAHSSRPLRHSNHYKHIVHRRSLPWHPPPAFDLFIVLFGAATLDRFVDVRLNVLLQDDLTNFVQCHRRRRLISFSRSSSLRCITDLTLDKTYLSDQYRRVTG